MYAQAPSDIADDAGWRREVRRPCDSDGVGQALRQIFSQSTTLPSDIERLLARLNR